MRDYATYLASPEWKRRKAGYFAFFARRCRACSSTLLVDLHHKTYERLGREFREDFAPLCRDCHNAVHLAHQRVQKTRTLAQAAVEFIRSSQVRRAALRRTETAFGLVRTDQAHHSTKAASLLMTGATRGAPGSRRRNGKRPKKRPMTSASRTTPDGGRQDSRPASRKVIQATRTRANRMAGGLVRASQQ